MKREMVRLRSPQVKVKETGPEGVKKATEDYLQYGKNLGKWLFLRVNSGAIVFGDGKDRRRVKLAPTGTPDFVVFRRVPHILVCRTIWIETKSTDGKQTGAQVGFECDAKNHGCEYYLVRDVAQLEAILPYEEI